MDVTTIFVATGLAAAAIAALAGRWAVAPLLVLAWPLFTLGVDLGFWGNGLGEAWQYVIGPATAAATVGAVVGVLAGRRLRPTRKTAWRAKTL